jgi:hypothetical protein
MNRLTSFWHRREPSTPPCIQLCIIEAYGSPNGDELARFGIDRTPNILNSSEVNLASSLFITCPIRFGESLIQNIPVAHELTEECKFWIWPCRRQAQDIPSFRSFSLLLSYLIRHFCCDDFISSLSFKMRLRVERGKHENLLSEFTFPPIYVGLCRPRGNGAFIFPRRILTLT